MPDPGRHRQVAAPHTFQKAQNKIMKNLSTISFVCLAAALGATSALADTDVSNPLRDHVAEANARFADVATAVAEGYAPIPCATGQQGGAMGIHYVSAA